MKSSKLVIDLLDAGKAVRIAEQALYDVPTSDPPRPIGHAHPQSPVDDHARLIDQMRTNDWHRACAMRQELRCAAEKELEAAAEVYLIRLFEALEDRIGTFVDAALDLSEVTHG